MVYCPTLAVDSFTFAFTVTLHLRAAHAFSFSSLRLVYFCVILQLILYYAHFAAHVVTPRSRRYRVTLLYVPFAILPFLRFSHYQLRSYHTHTHTTYHSGWFIYLLQPFRSRFRYVLDLLRCTLVRSFAVGSHYATHRWLLPFLFSYYPFCVSVPYVVTFVPRAFAVRSSPCHVHAAFLFIIARLLVYRPLPCRLLPVIPRFVIYRARCCTFTHATVQFYYPVPRSPYARAPTLRITACPFCHLPYLYTFAPFAR